MEQLQKLQDLQNHKIEQLSEKLQDLNIRVSFDDNEQEPIEKPKTKPTKNKKIELSEEEETEKTEDKAKRKEQKSKH